MRNSPTASRGVVIEKENENLAASYKHLRSKV